ncbi:MAG: alpha-1,2-fucosyltransferase [Anaerolineae bacterium]
MVIVQLIGGLGNQMFQYAAGRALAWRRGTALKLDISAFASYTLRSYRLHVFRIHEDFATPQEVAAVQAGGCSRTDRLLWRIRRRLGHVPYYARPIYREREHRAHVFDANLAQARRDVYLIGYWQSEKYFATIADLIREEFQLKREPSATSRELAQRICDCQAVSLHVRRGDYVTNPRTHQVHGVCSLEYYARCIAYIEQRVERPTFFVFSDDMDWARDHIRPAHPTVYVTHNGAARDYEDLWLMSQCKHHILANSSFSWWGAWLCENPDKIVIAPRRWFNEPGHDTRDLLPEGWVAL